MQTSSCWVLVISLHFSYKCISVLCFSIQATFFLSVWLSSCQTVRPQLFVHAKAKSTKTVSTERWHDVCRRPGWLALTALTGLAGLASLVALSGLAKLACWLAAGLGGLAGLAGLNPSGLAGKPAGWPWPGCQVASGQISRGSRRQKGRRVDLAKSSEPTRSTWIYNIIWPFPKTLNRRLF